MNKQMKETRNGLETNKQIIKQRKETSKHNKQKNKTYNERGLSAGGGGTGLTNEQINNYTDATNMSKHSIQTEQTDTNTIYKLNKQIIHFNPTNKK